MNLRTAHQVCSDRLATSIYRKERRLCQNGFGLHVAEYPGEGFSEVLHGVLGVFGHGLGLAALPLERPGWWVWKTAGARSAADSARLGS